MNPLIALTLALLMLEAGRVGIAAEEGVPVITDRADASIFPESWLRDPISAKGELLPENDRQDCRDLVTEELAKYPASLLHEHLARVHVLSRLEYHGVATGGTRSAKVVYLVFNPKISRQRLANNFHAEFSSILLRNRRASFDTTAWEVANPGGFAYRGSGVSAVKNGQASTRLSEELHREGFLNEYAKASIEEDFNSFAGRLFTGDPALWQAIGKFPRIAAKSEVAIAFYTGLDPRFSNAFFETLRQDR